MYDMGMQYVPRVMNTPVLCCRFVLVDLANIHKCNHTDAGEPHDQCNYPAESITQ